MPHDSGMLKLTERLSTGIDLGESHFREFKSALQGGPLSSKGRDVKSVCRDIAETLVAFANADGGELIVGVEDDGTISGVPHAEVLMAAMLEAPKSHVHQKTPLPSPSVARIPYRGKTVLYFQTAKSTQYVHLTCDGRCLQRFDRENRPVPAEEIQYSRQEQRSREYDRLFVDGARIQDLDLQSVGRASALIAGGRSPEKFLQYMDVAEYTPDGIRLRRAALLLFAKDISKWHPRCEVRILRVQGQTLGVGRDYNISARDDQIVRGNAIAILENVWDLLRPYLARTKLVQGVFRESLIYPEEACNEALVNSVAHRDYSIEGKGVEIFVYDDRLEVKSPGGLLSSISIGDLRSERRSHQSRNVYLARVLRELGYMREMGEGMLRIFSTMRDLDLVAPELIASKAHFDVVLHHRSVFSPKDQEWLTAYSECNLSRDEQRAVLLGRDGHLLSTNEIMKTLGIVDTDQFRLFVEHLRRKGILYNALSSSQTGLALRNVGNKRKVGRFAIRPANQTSQYREELMRTLAALGERARFSNLDLAAVKRHLSPSSPFNENLAESLKLLGIVDEKMRPLPVLTSLWQAGSTVVRESTLPSSADHVPKFHGKIQNLKQERKYGFIRDESGADRFFHISNLLDPAEWSRLRRGSAVTFQLGPQEIPGKPAPAKNVRRA